MQRRFNYIARLAFVLLVLGVPIFAQAACSANGYTVVYVNGVFDTEQQAKDNTDALQFRLGNLFNGQPITYTTGYNQTHAAGLGDLLEVAFPSLNQFDLDTILMRMHDEVQTRKLLIVGHSQGSMYANRIYDYLVTHGEPKDAVAIYAVATPEPIPSSKGNYLNYENDDTIYGPLASKVIHPPPFNISEAFYWTSTTTDGGSYKGHGFIDEYLASFADRITSEIKSELFVLRPSYASETLDECFSAPNETLGYKAEKVGFAVADPVVGLARDTVVGTYHVAAAVVGTTYNLAASAVGSVLGFFAPKPPDPDKERAVNDTGIALLHALNLTSLDVQTADQLQRDTQKKSNNSQGGAAILALAPEEPQAQGEVLGSSTDSAGSRQAEAAGTVPLPTAPAPMPGENVHYNAPAFGGLAVQEEAAPSPQPDTPATILTAPAIVFSNWRPQGGFQSQSCNPRHHESDLSWNAVPTATYYDLYEDDGSPSPLFLGTTTATTWLTPFVFNSNIQTTATVVARDAAGNAATSSVIANNQLADQQPPNFVSLSPGFAATAVPVNNPIVLTSNEPLATSTVASANFLLFQLDEAGGQTLLDSSASLGADNITVTLTPPLPLNYATGYRLVISCRVADVWGNGLSSDISLSPRYFTTGADPNAAPPEP